MELDNYLQLPSENIYGQYFDAVIAVSNFESRSTFLVSKLNVDEISNRLVLVFYEHVKLPICRENDQVFQQLGFTFNKVEANSIEKLPALLESLCQRESAKNLNILVDFTCMPKVWYKGIIDFFCNLDCEFANIHLWFSYSPSEYQKPTNFYSKITKDKLPKLSGKNPIAMIAGLGADNDCALDASSLLKPEVTYAYVAYSDIDTRYTADVLTKNEKFVKKTAPDKVLQYPLLDMNVLSKSLTNNSINLRTEYDVVLLPVGPKPFSLVCSVISARYPDIQVWNMPSEVSANPCNKKPSGDLILYKVTFTSEEVDY